MSRLEKHFEAEIVEWAEDRLGGEALKLKIEGRRGFPDRTLLLPGGIALFPEAKRSKNANRRAQQEYWVGRLNQLGFMAAFVSELDEVEAMYERHVWR